MITPSAIESLPVNKTLRDDLVTGLEVRSFPNGRKAYYIYFRTKLGKARHPKIGDCKIMSLADARKIAKEMLVIVAAGGDPISDRNGVRREPTVTDLWDKYLAGRASKLKGRAELERQWEKIIKPAIGKLRCREVQFEHILKIHTDMADAPYHANRVKALLSTMFTFAEVPLRWRDRGTNPCQGVRRYPEKTRRRYATGDELSRIGAALGSYRDQYPQHVAFLYMLLYTGARPAEIGTAQRSWLEKLTDGAGALRLPDSKTGQRTVYVPPQAMALIDSLPTYPDGTICGIASPVGIWRAVRRKAGCPDMRMYPDLRRTFASSAFANGESIDLVGGLLGHANRQTTLRYARLMEDAAVASVSSAGARMAALLGGGNDKPDVRPGVADEGNGHADVAVLGVAPGHGQVQQASYA